MQNASKITSKKIKFLSQFTPALHPHIFEFAKHLNAKKVDVVMLMARKAACFIDCLDELGLVALSGYITTDRLLDMNTSWLRGKNVLLVDEALISGTTLFKTKEKILKAGAKSVNTQIFIVNKDSYSKDLIHVSPPYLCLNDQETTSLCSDIVEAISLLPLPYGVDYPQFRNLRIPNNDIEIITNSVHWECHDVSSSLQKSNEIISLTLLPSTYLLENFHDFLGWKMTKGSHIFKIRLYGQLMNAKRKVYMFRVMPIAAFDPFSEEEIDEIWENFLPTYDSKRFEKYFTSYESKIRLLQYVVAARLGKLFINGISQSLTSKIQTQHDLRFMSYLFPPPVIPFVTTICQSDERLFNKNLVIKSDNVRSSIKKQYLESKRDLLQIQAALTKPFLDFFDYKEKKARELVLKHGLSVFSLPEHKEIMNRLNTGISLPELRAIINKHKDYIDVPKTVSLYIDFAIDRGIIVPILAKDQNIIFRAYRHGEDVRFTESEARLFCILLKAFISNCDKESVPYLTTEKLLVLLIKIGINKNFLTRWNGALGEDGTIGIRYFLMGAVLQEKSERIYETRLECGLPEIMKSSGYIKDNDDGYIVGYIPEAPVKSGAELESKAIGSLFAKLLYPSDPDMPKITQGELTLIASCLNPNEIAAALAAEINIFVNYWRKIQSIIYRGLNAEIRLDNLLDTIDEIRKREDIIFFEAVNNGRWKFISFMNNLPRKIIDSISEKLKDPIYNSTWQGFWHTTDQQENLFPEDLKLLINRQGSWCIRANIFVRLIEIALLQKEGSLSYKDNNEKIEIIRKEIRVLLKELSIYDKNQSKNINHSIQSIRNLIGNVDSDSYQKILLYSKRNLYNLIGEAKVILDTVDVTVTQFGKPASFTRYENAFYININPQNDKKQVWNEICLAFEKFRIQAKKESENTCKLGMVPFGQNGFPEGRWVCSTGKLGRSFLLKFINELLVKFDRLAKFKVILVTNLQNDWNLLKSENNSDFKGKHFWALAQKLKREITEDNGSVFSYVTPSGKRNENNLEDEIAKYITGLECLEEQKMIINEPSFLNFTLKQFAHTKGVKVKERKADVGIITIVPEETRAVKEFLEKSKDYKKEAGNHSKTIFYSGTIPKKNGSNEYKLVCTQQIDQGNRSVMSAYQRLVAEYKPTLIILLGIGGAIHPEVKLGDVVWADQIFYYDKRASTDKGAKRRAESYRIPAVLKPIINDYFVEKGTKISMSSENLIPSPNFNLHFGPLGTGEAVIKYRNASERTWLEKVNDKTLVLETEAGGFAQSFYEEDLLKNKETMGYLVIRGISDHADKEKDDQYRTVASQNAMLSLVNLLELISESPEDFIFTNVV